MRVSPSQINKFGICAKQWFFEKVLELDQGPVGSLTTLGSVWHYAADVYETYGHDLALAKRTFSYYWDAPHKIGLAIDYYHPRTTHEGLRKKGLDMLDSYHSLMPWKNGKLIGTEIRYEVPLGTHTLTGIIDKLFARPKTSAKPPTLEIIDFKTGAAKPAKLRFNLQFTAYCYATERPEFWEQLPYDYEDFIGHERIGWWYHARNTKMHSAGPRTEVDYRRLLLAVDEMERAHEANAYPLAISGEACGWCPFVEEICGNEMDDPRLQNMDVEPEQRSGDGKDEE